MCCQYFEEEKRIDFSSLCSSGGRTLMELGKKPVHLWVLILNTHKTRNTHWVGQTILLGNVLLMEMFLRLSSRITELTWAWMLGIFPEIQRLQPTERAGNRAVFMVCSTPGHSFGPSAPGRRHLQVSNPLGLQFRSQASLEMLLLPLEFSVSPSRSCQHSKCGFPPSSYPWCKHRDMRISV